MSPALRTTTTAALARAHHSAEAVVQTILAITDSLEQGRRIDTSLLMEVVFFLRTFSDKCQTAEEDALLDRIGDRFRRGRHENQPARPALPVPHGRGVHLKRMEIMLMSVEHLLRRTHLDQKPD